MHQLASTVHITQHLYRLGNHKYLPQPMVFQISGSSGYLENNQGFFIQIQKQSMIQENRTKFRGSLHTRRSEVIGWIGLRILCIHFRSRRSYSKNCLLLLKAAKLSHNDKDCKAINHGKEV